MSPIYNFNMIYMVEKGVKRMTPHSFGFVSKFTKENLMANKVAHRQNKSWQVGVAV